MAERAELIEQATSQGLYSYVDLIDAGWVSPEVARKREEVAWDEGVDAAWASDQNDTDLPRNPYYPYREASEIMPDDYLKGDPHG